MSNERAEATAAQARTQREILRVAIRTLLRDPATSMSGIAAAADVSRSTLHRYFPDRDALRAAVDTYVDEEYQQCASRAAAVPGDGRTRFLRLVDEILGDSETFAWWTASDANDGSISDEDPLRALISAGQDDGSIDAALPPEWIGEMTWGAAYVAYTRSRSGRESRPAAAELCVRTINKLITPQSP